MNFKSTNNSDLINYEIFDDVLNPVGVIIMVHGMQEYGARYYDFKNHLNKFGYVVVLYDHLGHGKSAKSINDLGYFHEKKGYTHLIDDLHLLKNIVKEKYPDLKLYLIGHSMGSFILRNYLYKYANEKIDGAIIIGTAGPNPLLNVGLILSSIMKKFNPKKKNKFLNRMAFGSYNKKFKGETKVAWVCGNLEVQEKYLADIYCNFIFTTSAFNDLFKLLKNISSKKWAEGLNKDLPILMLSGETDPVGNYKKGVIKVFNRLKQKNKKLIIYPNMRHEILNEKDKIIVYNDIINWLEKN